MLLEFRLFLFAVVATLLIQGVRADEPGPSAGEQLQNDQEAISGRYARFERLLSQMADMLGQEDPERAELLRRAISKGREQAISGELEAIARKLGEGDFGAAREKQVTVSESLQILLKLLQSEDRRSAAEKERERLNAILKNVQNAILEQRAARGATQNSNAPSSAAPSQQKALNRTDKVIDDIQNHDAEAAAGKDGSSESSGEPSDGSNSSDEKSPSEDKQESSSDSGQSQQGDGKSAESSNGEPDSKDPSSGDKNDSSKPETDPGKQSEEGDPSGQGDSQQMESSGDSDSQESQGQGSQSPSGKPQQGGQSSSSPQSGGGSEDQDNAEQQTPGRQNLEQARNMMQEALEQLKQQEREGALDQQDAAITELQKAASELEEMLRQLREEEKEMILAALEARLQRLLAQQIQINDTTVDLAATPRESWLDNAVSQCRELSQQQADLKQECSQTTGLLREDGTSVSILVSIEDVEADMQTVAERLRETRAFALTQSIQQDIREALEELIKATQTEMEEMKSEQRQQQQQQSNSQQKPPLVELMAEIKVLRSLQLRVNRRTKNVDGLLREAQPEDVAGLNQQLNELSDRQFRLRESARELADRMEKRQ